MVNLASLSALLRTLRQAEDGSAQPVGRIPQIRRVAADAEAALRGTARDAPTARGTLAPPARAGADTALAQAAAPRGERAEASSLALTRGGSLVAMALQARERAQPAAIATAAPLAGSARAAAPEMAQALARAVTESGLFYESHLERWSRDAYPRDALAREPQAGWPRGGDASAGPGPTVPAAAHAMLSRQLDVLDTRAIAWSGLAWPGQPLQVTIEEQARDVHDRDAEPSPGPARAWRTRVVLDLPSLGPVEARLALTGGTLDVALVAQDDDAAVRLADARPHLAAALAQAQVPLRAFAVARSVGSAA